MMDLPTALRAGLCILQLVLVLALARFPLERAGGHDALRLARDAAVGVSLLPVPVLGPVLGAATLIALVILRRRADDGARAALSRLASSALLPGRTTWWGRDDKASDRCPLDAAGPAADAEPVGAAEDAAPVEFAASREVRRPGARLPRISAPDCDIRAHPPAAPALGRSGARMRAMEVIVAPGRRAPESRRPGAPGTCPAWGRPPP